MNLTSRLKSAERLVGRGGCRECHGEGGGGTFVIRPGDDEVEPPDRACKRCGKMGPPAFIFRIVYTDTKPMHRDAE